jgi:hypothetical protein
MISKSVFDNARELLSQGDTGQALDNLIAALEGSGGQPEALRTLRVVEANYNTARQKEQKGILSFPDAQRAYSQANDAILGVLDDLAAGRKPVASAPVSRRVWFVGGGALLLVGVLLGWWLMRPPADVALKKTDSKEPACPTFEPQKFRVMLLPFQKLGGADSRPAASIQTRIRDLTARNDLPTDVEILLDKKFEESTPDIEEARRLGKQCEADLVVWGQYEGFGGDSVAVDVRYVFTEMPEWAGRTEFQGFRGVAALQSGKSEALRSLDDAIFSLCSAMAIHAGRLELAEKWMGKLTKPVQGDNEMKEISKEIKARMRG